jgi:hypothetical protein
VLPYVFVCNITHQDASSKTIFLPQALTRGLGYTVKGGAVIRLEDSLRSVLFKNNFPIYLLIIVV